MNGNNKENEMETTEIRAYRRNADGTLDYTTILVLNGQPCDMGGHPLTHTADAVELLGWPDAECDVYTTDGGVEVLVPRPGLARWAMSVIASHHSREIP